MPLSRSTPLLALVALSGACPGWWEPTADATASTSTTFAGSGSPVTGSTATSSPTTGTSTGGDPVTSTSSTGETGGSSGPASDLPRLDDAWCQMFDPGRVYLAGTFYEGGSSADALAQPEEPRRACVGFPESPRILHVRPTDGRLLWVGYFDDAHIHVLSPDELRWDKNDDRWDYPNFPHDNDELIGISPCDDLWDFVVHPTKGTVVYGCINQQDGLSFYREGGEHVLTTSQEEVLAVAADDTLLLWEYADQRLASLRFDQGPAIVPEPGTETAAVVAVRARESGFWLVLQPDGEPAERWSLGMDGALVLDGVYTPDGDGDLDWQDQPELTDAGDLVHFSETKGNPIETLIKRSSIGGPVDVIYNELDAPAGVWPFGKEPYVYAFGSLLFTGP